jgi:hypothetical protein
MTDLGTGILTTVVGAALGVLGTQLNYKLQTKRRVLHYSVNSTPILRPSEVGGKLTITVDKAVLTGVERDRGVMEPVGSADIHNVKIKNVGNQETDNFNWQVNLHESAKIIDFDAKVGGESVAAEIRAGERNIVYGAVPYLNPTSAIKVKIISAFNQEPDSCSVNMNGKGIAVESSDKGVTGSLVVAFFGLFGAIFIAGIWSGSIIQDSTLGRIQIFSQITSWLGGDLSTTSVPSVSWPLLPQIGLLAAAAVCGIIAVLAIRRLVSRP